MKVLCGEDTPTPTRPPGSQGAAVHALRGDARPLEAAPCGLDGGTVPRARLFYCSFMPSWVATQSADIKV